MKFSLGLPTERVEAPDEFVSGPAVTEMAQHAEDLGYSSVFVTDHPAPDTKWLEAGGHHALDPMVALAFAAASTKKIALLSHLYILAYRNPFLAAKSILSVDALSGGRLILGVGAGYLKPEFGALGVDFDSRNELLDESLEVLGRLFTEDSVAYEGTGYRSRGTSMLPKPIAQPHPPIWIGGNSKIAIRRAVEFAQGWIPFPNPDIPARAVRTASINDLDDLAERIAYLRSCEQDAGRDRLDISFSTFSMREPNYDHSEVLAEVENLAQLGITSMTLNIEGDDRATWMNRAEEFADRVLQPASS